MLGAYLCIFSNLEVLSFISSYRVKQGRGIGSLNRKQKIRRSKVVEAKMVAQCGYRAEGRAWDKWQQNRQNVLWKLNSFSGSYLQKSEIETKMRRQGSLSEVMPGESAARLDLRRKEKKATRKSAHMAAWRGFPKWNKRTMANSNLGAMDSFRKVAVPG